jgi:Tol biopolymer transport system component
MGFLRLRHAATGVAALGLLSASLPQVTQRVSVASNGVQANGGGDLPSPPGAVLSADGRFVAFMSGSTNLIPNDTNGTWDVFVRDRVSGTTERVSVDSSGSQANGFSGLYGIAISADGRYVAFESAASNLVPSDTNGVRDIFVRDRLIGTTERASVATGGAQGDGNCFHLAMSLDGRYVAFESLATNLVPGDANGQPDVFVRDRVSGTTELVSISTSGAQGNGISEVPAISADGRFVAFESIASNLIAGDSNGVYDVFVRDRQSATTERVSIRSGGAQSNGPSYWASISANGRFVSFTSEATNLVPGDTNAHRDVFVRDSRNATTERVSLGVGGTQGNGDSFSGFISADGRYVAFSSGASNLVPNVTTPQVYFRDLQTGAIEVASIASDGSLSNGAGDQVCVTAGGRYVVFRSAATNLVPGDTNANTDVFLHDRQATGFTSVCEPGSDNVIACPCGNAPSTSGRGCDNSSATGGGMLAASGIAYLSIDSLVFTTGGQVPSSLSLLLQGNAVLPSGVVYGQGLRCAGGTLKRLFIKTSQAGSVTAPDFGAGDSTVSARSSNLGDSIQPGESRWYFVYYRDMTVLGGCPATSTFNATQAGRVTWSM